MRNNSDKALHEALKKAYAKRARLFFSEVQKRAVDILIKDVESIDSKDLNWELESLGISKKAFSKIQKAGTPPHYIFAHPEILQGNPHLEDYYRNLAALSKKGLSQILSGIEFRSSDKSIAVSFVVNGIISQIVETMKGFRLEMARSVILAEIGAEIQGSWVNVIGQGAARNVEKLLKDYAESRGYIKSRSERTLKKSGKSKKEREIVLKNGWKIIFGSEPDIAIRNKQDVLKMAIEIKGSMDKAGAQTRYGEAKKSFAKALAENPRCETIYLASCFTQSVINQIDIDGQVRQTHNLIDILDNPRIRQSFLDEIFRFHIRI